MPSATREIAVGVLTAALTFTLVACLNGESDSADMRAQPLATVTATPTATAASPSPSPSPTPASTPIAEVPSSPTPEPPAVASASVQLSPTTARQGEVFSVRLRNAPTASSATTTFAGLDHPMLPTDDMWWAVIGIAANFVSGEYQVQVSEDGTKTLPILVLTVLEAGFPEEFITLEPEQAQLLTDPAAIEEERQLLASVHAAVTPERLWSGPFVLPTAGPIGDTFGMRRSFNEGPFSHHTGVDILASEGEPVVAANSGRVALAGELYLRGNTVIIDHGAGVFSGYHHLAQVLVVEGQDVAQSEVIGAVGGTGLATAPHLHWEIVVRGVRVDPIPWTQAEIGP